MYTLGKYICAYSNNTYDNRLKNGPSKNSNDDDHRKRHFFAMGQFGLLLYVKSGEKYSKEKDPSPSVLETAFLVSPFDFEVCLL